MAKFEVVEDEATPEPAPTRSPVDLSLLTLAFKSLSQRAIVAIADYLWVCAVASVFWLWHETPDPSIPQLIKLGMYGVFVLAACMIVRRK
jgi:hypothetical protein